MANRAERRAQKKWKVEDFREQAIEAMGQTASITFELPGTDEVFEVPHPLAMDDEMQARVEAFQRGDGLDRETILDEDGKPILDSAGNPVTVVKEPHQVDGVILEPVSIRSAKVILGEDVHARFIEAGGRSNDVSLAWQYMVDQTKERQETDPK
jgi:hypothetical protein